MGIRKYLLLLGVLVVALIIVQAFAYVSQSGPSNISQSAGIGVHSDQTAVAPPQPPMTPADTVAQQNQQPFSSLVSYTNTGFQPMVAHIHVGQTVRFTNNSASGMWIAASGSRLYPNTQHGCGSSDLDSCSSLTPGEFWQFTFAQKGTWQYVNNLNKSMQGTIVVQ